MARLNQNWWLYARTTLEQQILQMVICVTKYYGFLARWHAPKHDTE